jgi:hypothetical protein
MTPKKKKAGPWQQAARETANREDRAMREKEKAARLANAKKQKRYRDSMKARGIKQY